MSTRPPSRRDAEGRRQVGTNWESLTERLIREAQERGDFDDLPLHGKPLPDRSNPHAGEMALAYEMLHAAGVAPPWIEADKDARARLAERDRLLALARRSALPMRSTLLRNLTNAVAAYNADAARINAAAPSERQHRRPLVLADEVAALEANLGADLVPQPDPSTEA
ncbi:MAG: DnaJ ue, subfamily er 28, conserved domain [Chloroflexota bacterium]|nr:DnaJ ue, subfamily er 28, conserved domain [Chloroflexota bacterium]